VTAGLGLRSASGASWVVSWCIPGNGDGGAGAGGRLGGLLWGFSAGWARAALVGLGTSSGAGRGCLEVFPGCGVGAWRFFRSLESLLLGPMVRGRGGRVVGLVVGAWGWSPSARGGIFSGARTRGLARLLTAGWRRGAAVPAGHRPATYFVEISPENRMGIPSAVKTAHEPDEDTPSLLPAALQAAH
jgi:hypothetical protein